MEEISTGDSSSKAIRSQAMFNSLQQSRNQVDDADVVLICKNVRFPAHRIRLMASSPYFEALFENHKQAEVTLDVDDDAMKFVMDYIYNQASSKDLDGLEHTIKVMQAAHVLQLRDLCMDTCTVVLRKISPEQVPLLATLARSGYPLVMHTLKRVIKICYPTIYKHHLFLAYPYHVFSVFVDVVWTDYLGYLDILMDVIAKWIKKNPKWFVANVANFAKLAVDINLHTDLVNMTYTNFMELIRANREVAYTIVTLPEAHKSDKLSLSLKIMQFEQNGTSTGLFRNWTNKTNVSKTTIPEHFQFSSQMKAISFGANVVLVDYCHAQYFDLENSSRENYRNASHTFRLKMNMDYSETFLANQEGCKVVEQLLVFNNKIVLFDKYRDGYVNFCIRKSVKSFSESRCKSVRTDSPCIVFPLDHLILFVVQSNDRIQFKTITSTDFHDMEKLVLTPFESKFHTLPFRITLKNTVPFGSKLHSFHQDMIYVYQTETDDFVVLPSDYAVHEDDVVHLVPEYKEDLYVVLQRKCSNQCLYKLWRVGHSEISAKTTLDLESSDSEPVVLIHFTEQRPENCHSDQWNLDTIPLQLINMDTCKNA